jgi:CheY-like chemotaxis protein
MEIVMFIDDNADTLEVMERSINMLGYEVLTCIDEKNALQAAIENLPGIIFTDLALQNIDGLTLLRSFKGHPQTKSIPVIVVSASSSPQDRLDAIAAGADAFLEKPIRFDELNNIFEKFLVKPNDKP